MIFHDYPFSAPRFQSAPATRCLLCKSTNLDAEDVLQNGDEDWSEDNPPDERTFWYCRDCSDGDAVPVGVGVMNEVTRRVSWLERFSDAADVGTLGLSQQDAQPLYEVDWDKAGGIEIIPLWKRLPHPDEARRKYLRQAVGLDGSGNWPLQVATRASAFALALHSLAQDNSEEATLQQTVAFNGASISGREMWRQALAEEPFSRVAFFRRSAQHPGGRKVAALEIVRGQLDLKSEEVRLAIEMPRAIRSLSPADGESFIDALLLRYSGSYFWAAREK